MENKRIALCRDFLKNNISLLKEKKRGRLRDLMLFCIFAAD